MANKGKKVRVAEASLETLKRLAAARGSATTCPQGHAYPDLRVGNAKQRRCRECKRRYEREWYKRKRAQKKTCQIATCSTETPASTGTSETKPSLNGQSNSPF